MKQTLIYKILKIVYIKLNDFKLKLACFWFRHVNVQNNKVVVDNFAGKGFGDNPKYIINQMLKLNPHLQIVWLVNDLNEKIPGKIRKVRYGSIASIKELSSAKIWIDNIKNSIKPHKKSNQFYLQTWHGGIGLKAVEKMIVDELPASYVNDAKRDAHQTDLMISDSNWTTNIFSKWFWYDGRIVVTGFPRNDLLINKPKGVITKVHTYFSIKRDQKIILYAPTFRANEGIEPYRFNFQKIVEAFQSRFGGNYVLLIRLHPNISSSSAFLFKDISGNDGQKIINASDYPDMQELIAASDDLISDFSSCIFDGMISGCKVFLLAKDYRKYISTQRSLLFKLGDLPFSFSRNELQLLKAIHSFDENVYNERIKAFMNSVQLFEDGNASERVAKILLNHILD